MHNKQDCLTLRTDSSHAKYLHGECGEYGLYHELSVLLNKIAQYLFEFKSEAHSYASLHLPEIPLDAPGRCPGRPACRNQYELNIET